MSKETSSKFLMGSIKITPLPVISEADSEHSSTRNPKNKSGEPNQIPDDIIKGYMSKASLNSRSENVVRFIMDVDRLQDIINDISPHKTPTRNWTEIDRDVDIMETWDKESRKYLRVLINNVAHQLSRGRHKIHEERCKVDNELIYMQVDKIVGLYLNDDSPRQIYIAAPILHRTRLRIKYISLYEADAFAETLGAAVQTIPWFKSRFIKTPEYSTMMKLYETSNPLPLRGSLNLNNLRKKMWTSSKERSLTSKTSIRVNFDASFYEKFLSYSILNNCEGCVLGCQLLNIFYDARDRNEMKLSEAYAWKIYQYYVAIGSCYQCTLSPLIVNEIMRNLAAPTNKMFVNLKHILQDQCDAVFEHFNESNKSILNDCSTKSVSKIDDLSKGEFAGGNDEEEENPQHLIKYFNPSNNGSIRNRIVRFLSYFHFSS